MPIKPSQNEEKYFRELELKARLEKLAKEQETTAKAEKHRLKELHWLHCPKCGQRLSQEHYGKVEVDVCAACKGLWLDANELEAILQGAKSSNPFHSFLKILGQ
ncbi:MAG: zf-TFIIB domain-containing protein [Verrucomicrobia bacterium]|nr:zf-TFIIB domain-containing protein [Verrucomicrobiota bacterium]